MSSKFDRLIQIDPIQSNMLSFQYLKKDVILIFFSQTIFLSIVRVISEHVKSTSSHQINPHKAKKNYTKKYINNTYIFL
jgi:hypothetical protein